MNQEAEKADEILDVFPRAARSIIVVVDKMIEQVPKSEGAFLVGLIKSRTQFLTASPELDQLCWVMLSKLISQFLPDPVALNDWQKKLVNVFMGRDGVAPIRPDTEIRHLDDTYTICMEGGLQTRETECYKRLRAYLFALEQENEKLKEFEYLYNNERRILTP